MGLIYFMTIDGKGFIKLDCEKAVEMSKSNKVTPTTTFDGKTLSDGYVEGNTILNLSGKLSYVKPQGRDSDLNPEEIQKEILKYEKSHQRFSVYTSAEYLYLLNELDDCVITSHSVKLNGTTNSVDISMTIESQYISKAASLGIVFPKRSSEAAESYSYSSDNGKGKSDSRNTEQNNSLMRSITEGVGIEGSIFGE